MKQIKYHERLSRLMKRTQRETAGRITFSFSDITEILNLAGHEFAASDACLLIIKDHASGHMTSIARYPQDAELRGENMEEWVQAISVHEGAILYENKNKNKAVSRRYRSWLAIPIIVRKELFALIITGREKRVYNEKELAAASHAAIFLNSTVRDIRKRNRRHRAIGEETRHKQLLLTQSLLQRRRELPVFFSQINDYTAAVGSDLAQIYRIGETRLLSAIMDHTAQEAERASGLVYMDTWLRVMAHTSASPQEVIRALNQDICRRPGEGYAALAILHYDRNEQMVDISGAGNITVLVFEHETMQVSPLSFGPVIGIHENQDFEAFRFPVNIGDIICLCSDGVTESRLQNGELAGTERIAAIIRKQYFLQSAELAARIMQITESSIGDGLNSDDRTVQILKIE